MSVSSLRSNSLHSSVSSARHATKPESELHKSPHSTAELSRVSRGSDRSVRVDTVSFPSIVAIYPFALTEIICEEMKARTALVCDEMTDFQRIVSGRTAERYGMWSYSIEAQAHQYFCEECGHYVTTRATRKPGVDNRLPFELHGKAIRTPSCSYAELNGADGCFYTQDALTTLKRREVFDQDTSALLARVRMASKGIRDSVM